MENNPADDKADVAHAEYEEGNKVLSSYYGDSCSDGDVQRTSRRYLVVANMSRSMGGD